MERAGKYLLLLADFLKCLGNIVRESLELVSNVRKVAFNLVVVLLGLVHMGSPLLAIAGVLVDLELMGNSLNFKHPFVSANR